MLPRQAPLAAREDLGPWVRLPRLRDGLTDSITHERSRIRSDAASLFSASLLLLGSLRISPRDQLVWRNQLVWRLFTARASVMAAASSVGRRVETSQ
ncbi:hypothetical protein ACFPRL_00815 [Pseudoclavibacter helvolus]